jgi:hypothetical protein
MQRMYRNRQNRWVVRNIMKLTRRGKAVLSVLILTMLIASVNYYATHHRVYGDCLKTKDGTVCKLLKWED